MLTPDLLPDRISRKCSVLHRFPDEWDLEEVDQHRFDSCPCSPEMHQDLSSDVPYRWVVTHTRISRTEEQPL